jgi:hypothetical protein
MVLLLAWNALRMPFSNFTNDFFVKKVAFIKEAACC